MTTRAKKRRSKAQKWKSKVHTSGDLAEEKVKELFGLEEPRIEIKSARRRNWHVVVPMTQLESHANNSKDYCIVVYDREIKATKKPKQGNVKPALTIKQAYERPLEFIFLSAVDMVRQVVEQRHQIRAIISNKRVDVRFYGYLSLKKLRDRAGENYTIDRHRVYGIPPEAEEPMPVKPDDDIPF